MHLQGGLEADACWGLTHRAKASTRKEQGSRVHFFLELGEGTSFQLIDVLVRASNLGMKYHE